MLPDHFRQILDAATPPAPPIYANAHIRTSVGFTHLAKTAALQQGLRAALSEFLSPGLKTFFGGGEGLTEPVLLNVYGAPELIPRNEFRKPM